MDNPNYLRNYEDDSWRLLHKNNLERDLYTKYLLHKYTRNSRPSPSETRFRPSVHSVPSRTPSPSFTPTIPSPSYSYVRPSSSPSSIEYLSDRSYRNKYPSHDTEWDKLYEKRKRRSKLRSSYFEESSNYGTQPSSDIAYQVLLEDLRRVINKHADDETLPSNKPKGSETILTDLYDILKKHSRESHSIANTSSRRQAWNDNDLEEGEIRGNTNSSFMAEDQIEMGSLVHDLGQLLDKYSSPQKFRRSQEFNSSGLQPQERIHDEVPVRLSDLQSSSPSISVRTQGTFQTPQHSQPPSLAASNQLDASQPALLQQQELYEKLKAQEEAELRKQREELEKLKEARKQLEQEEVQRREEKRKLEMEREQIEKEKMHLQNMKAIEEEKRRMEQEKQKLEQEKQQRALQEERKKAEEEQRRIIENQRREIEEKDKRHQQELERMRVERIKQEEEFERQKRETMEAERRRKEREETERKSLEQQEKERRDKEMQEIEKMKNRLEADREKRDQEEQLRLEKLRKENQELERQRIQHQEMEDQERREMEKQKELQKKISLPPLSHSSTSPKEYEEDEIQDESDFEDDLNEFEPKVEPDSSESEPEIEIYSNATNKAPESSTQGKPQIENVVQVGQDDEFDMEEEIIEEEPIEEEDLEESLDSPKKPAVSQQLVQEVQLLESDGSADLDEMEDLFKATASGSDSIGSTPVASPSISKLQQQIGFDSKPHLLQSLSGGSSTAPKNPSSLRPQTIVEENSGKSDAFSSNISDEDFLDDELDLGSDEDSADPKTESKPNTNQTKLPSLSFSRPAAQSGRRPLGGLNLAHNNQDDNDEDVDLDELDGLSDDDLSGLTQGKTVTLKSKQEPQQEEDEFDDEFELEKDDDDEEFEF